MKQEISRIASEILAIPTLDIRGSDSLDFYDLNVLLIKDALEAAFHAGISKAKEEMLEKA